MVPFEFEYYRPGSAREAVQLWRELRQAGMTPVYYAGGSELLTMARAGNIQFCAVIDIKGIPECRDLGEDGDTVYFGAAATLGEIEASGLFPLLGRAGGRVADHTMQQRITLGGNISGTIRYRETALPLLLADAEMAVCAPDGVWTAPIHQVFSGRLSLPEGAFLTGCRVLKEHARAPHAHIKKTKNERIDYPVATLCALETDGYLRWAASGVLENPFRDLELEEILNDRRAEPRLRAEKIVEALRPGAVSDVFAAAEFRLFVLKGALMEILSMEREVALA